MKVKCTTQWWYNRTLIPKGAVIDVPEGTPVPQGFIVDGKEVPRRPRNSVVEQTKDKMLAEKDAEIEALKGKVASQESRLASLEEQIAKIAATPRVYGRSGRKEG